MRVGLDLRQVRPVRSGGIWVFFQELLEALVADTPGDAFWLFQSAADPPLVPTRHGLTLESVPCDQPRSAVDERASALALDVLFRAFPSGFHGFPPERQVVFVPDLQHDFLPELFDLDVLRDRRRRFGAALRYAGAIATPSEFCRRSILARVGRHPGVDPG